MLSTALITLLLATSTIAAPAADYKLPTSSTPPTSTALPTGLPASCTTETKANPTLFSALTLAPNAVDRLALISDADLVFKFNDPCRLQGVAKGLGGNVTRADHASFPALTTQKGSVAVGFLSPCGFNTPHVHPRSSELNLVIEGSLFAQFVAENGAVFRSHTLNKFDMTVFPQGAIHTEFNPLCTPSTFVASFPDEDPGVGQIAQEFFGLTDEIVQGALGGDVNVAGQDIDAFKGKLPVNVVKGVESCLKKCGIKKREVAA